jgi:hypothetical protein
LLVELFSDILKNANIYHKNRLQVDESGGDITPELEPVTGMDTQPGLEKAVAFVPANLAVVQAEARTTTHPVLLVDENSLNFTIFVFSVGLYFEYIGSR